MKKIIVTSAQAEQIMSGKKSQVTFGMPISEAESTDYVSVGLMFLGCQKYGRVCEIRAVHEPFSAFGRYIRTGVGKSGQQTWRFVQEGGVLFDHPGQLFDSNDNGATALGWYQRPAKFLPEHSCRIFIKITSVKLKRLSEVAFHEAIDEGFKVDGSTKSSIDRYKEHFWKHHRKEIVGEDPMVVIVKFEKVER